MKRLASTLLLITIAAICSFGKSVDISTLKTIGSNFLLAAGVPGVKNSTDLTTVYSGVGFYNGAPVTALYVFAVTSGKGWVMVSADDIVKPVLAYSGESVFDVNNMAPATKEWISDYETRIAFAISKKIPARATVRDDWNNLEAGVRHLAAKTTSGVLPLIATTWDQGYPYNDSVPFVPARGYKTATGCVATCMAQIMKYWNWPTIGCGYHAYLDTPFGMLSADFGTTAYQWSSMPAMPTAANPAIAQLMFHAGVSVNMEYNFLGTGNSNSLTNTRQSFITPCEEFALKTNFHYKRSLHSLYRSGTVPGNIEGSGPDSIDEASWKAYMKADLDAGRPISYTGYNAANGEGHCWLLDGYTVLDYFHFNWGWSGSSNGFFTVDDLLPPTIGFNLNYNQAAILGIEPDSFPSDPGNIQLQTWLKTSNTPARWGTPVSVSTKIFNSDATPFNGDICAQLYDTTNNVAGIIQTISGQSIAAGSSSAMLTFSSTGIFNIASGTYGVRIACRPTGSSVWTPVANNGNFINYTNIAFYNDTDIELVEPLSLPTGLKLIQNQPISFNAIISNWAFAADGNNLYWAHGNFNGNLQATLNSTTDNSVVFTIQTLANQVIDTNNIDTFTFSNSSLAVPTGQYLLEIGHQYNGSGPYHLTGSTFECNPLLVNVVRDVSVPVQSQTNAITVYPIPATNDLAISSPLKISDVTINNILGQLVYSGKYDDNKISLDISALRAGVYFVTINRSTVRKFVKE